jgi:yecA family protein
MTEITSNNESSNNLMDFSTMQAILTSENVKSHASELHGVLTGLICAGFEFEDQGYLVILHDLFNEGDGFPTAVKKALKQMYSELWSGILDDSYSFNLLLPDDDDSMAERGHALSVWVQGFNLGFGLQQKDTPVVSEEVKEVLTDFGEIANLSDEMEEDEDTEQAYFEIGEYVRISALLCFSELATPPNSESLSEDKKTLH